MCSMCVCAELQLERLTTSATSYRKCAYMRMTVEYLTLTFFNRSILTDNVCDRAQRPVESAQPSTTGILNKQVLNPISCAYQRADFV